MTEPQSLYERRAPLRSPPPNGASDRLLRLYYSFLFPAGVRVLNVGCRSVCWRAVSKPSRGPGIDADAVLIDDARRKRPSLEFQAADQPLSAHAKFDYFLLSDLVNYLSDVQSLLERLQGHS